MLSLQQFLDEGIDPAEVRPLTLLELMCCISEIAIDERNCGLLSHTAEKKHQILNLAFFF